jgi:hypothetical protein
MVYISDLNVLDEYIQLTNRGPVPVAMTGWTIANNHGRSFYFLQWTNPDGSKYDYELGGHSTVTISTGREGIPTQTRLFWPEKMWNNTGDTAYLYDKKGNLVSTLSR